MAESNKAFNLSSYFNYKERETAIKIDEMFDLKNHFGGILNDPRRAILFDLVQRKVAYKTQILKHLSYICEKHLILVTKNQIFSTLTFPHSMRESFIFKREVFHKGLISVLFFLHFTIQALKKNIWAF